MKHCNTQFSLLIPVFQAERFLTEALESILPQCEGFGECLTIDDGSTDRSLKILQGFQRRFSCLQVISRANTGIVGALNDGLSVSRGRYIVRMDADDIAYPQRIVRQLAFMEAHPDIVGCGTWVRMVWRDGRPIFTYRTPEKHDDILRQLLNGNGGAMIHPATAFRREALLHVGGYRQEAIWFEDLDLYLRLAQVGRLANIPEVLLDYRQHLSSVNQSEKKWRQLSYQYQVVNNHRRQCGLAELSGEQRHTNLLTDALDHWIGLSLAEGNVSTARHLALHHWRLQPFQRKSWQLLRLVYGN
jgi:glycosyltransferase involved in cell wall biosynthesis